MRPDTGDHRNEEEVKSEILDEVVEIPEIEPLEEVIEVSDDDETTEEEVVILGSEMTREITESSDDDCPGFVDDADLGADENAEYLRFAKDLDSGGSSV